MNPISSNVSSSQDIVNEIQSLFVNINDKIANYWGVLHGKLACPLACLKCNKVMVDFIEFAELGPRHNGTVMFCKDDAPIFYYVKDKLKKAAEEEGKDFNSLLEKAMHPYLKIEKQCIEELERLTPQKKNQKWVFLG